MAPREVQKIVAGCFGESVINSAEKIAVLGGGISALAAVFDLTSDRNWQNRYDITVYQMGWRLGGKGASSRNLDPSHRLIEEHGLHIWLGFYENAFEIMRRAHSEVLPNSGTFRSSLDLSALTALLCWRRKPRRAGCTGRIHFRPMIRYREMVPSCRAFGIT
jgi:uncharacterized protein with NAD-binding domain and iron-sulfur cluster